MLGFLLTVLLSGDKYIKNISYSDDVATVCRHAHGEDSLISIELGLNPPNRE